MDRALTDAASALFGVRCDKPGPPGGRDDLLRRFDRDTDRFLTQDVYAAPEEFAGHHVMQPVGTADVCTVNIKAAVQELVDRTERLYFPARRRVDRVGKGPSTIKRRIHRGNDAEPVFPRLDQFLIPLEMSPGDTAAPYHGKIDHFFWHAEPLISESDIR